MNPSRLWLDDVAARSLIPGANGAGGMTGGGAKILHHTTEGGTMGGAETTYASTHNLPHFTDTFEHGVYVAHQHLPLNVAATALVHQGGATNTDDVIQIEHVGFTATSAGWAPGYLDGIAGLCRAIETACGIPASATVTFTDHGCGPWPGRLSWAEWDAYTGHLGHQHAPENTHCDPGPIAIGRILGHGTPPPGGHMNAPPVAVLGTGDDRGYLIVAADGGVFAYGDAPFYGSLGATHINAPITDAKWTPDLKGYYMVGEDGGIYTFGDAQFHGSLGGTTLNKPIVGMAVTPSGGGYWLVAADGGVFAFGDAPYLGRPS